MFALGSHLSFCLVSGQSHHSVSYAVVTAGSQRWHWTCPLYCRKLNNTATGPEFTVVFDQVKSATGCWTSNKHRTKQRRSCSWWSPLAPPPWPTHPVQPQFFFQSFVAPSPNCTLRIGPRARFPICTPNTRPKMQLKPLIRLNLRRNKCKENSSHPSSFGAWTWQEVDTGSRGGRVQGDIWGWIVPPPFIYEVLIPRTFVLGLYLDIGTLLLLFFNFYLF